MCVVFSGSYPFPGRDGRTEEKKGQFHILEGVCHDRGTSGIGWESLFEDPGEYAASYDSDLYGGIMADG